MPFILNGKMSNDGDDKSSISSSSSTSITLEKIDSENALVQDIYKNPAFSIIEVPSSIEKNLDEGDKIGLIESQSVENNMEIITVSQESCEKSCEDDGISKKNSNLTKFKGLKINPWLYSRPFVGIFGITLKKHKKKRGTAINSHKSTYSTDSIHLASSRLNQQQHHEEQRQLRTVFSSFGGSSMDLTADLDEYDDDEVSNLLSRKSSRSNSEEEIKLSSSANKETIGSSNVTDNTTITSTFRPNSSSDSIGSGSREKNKNVPRLRNASMSDEGLLLGGGRKEEKERKEAAKKALEDSSSGSGVEKTSAASKSSKGKGKDKDKEGDASKSSAGEGGEASKSSDGEVSKASGKKPADGKKAAGGSQPGTDMKVESFSTQGFEENETPANEFKKNSAPAAEKSNDQFPNSGKPKGWRQRALCKLGVVYDRGCPLERPHPKTKKDKEEPVESETQPVEMGGTGKSESVLGKMKSSLSSLSSKISGSISKMSNSSFNKSSKSSAGGSAGASSTAADDDSASGGGSAGGIGHYKKMAHYQDPSSLEYGGLMGGGGSKSEMGTGSNTGQSGGSLFAPSTGSQGSITNAPGDPGKSKAPQGPPPPRTHKYPSALEEYCFGGLPPGVPEAPKPIEIPTDGAEEKKGLLASLSQSLSSMGSNLSQSMSKMKSSVSKSVSSMKSKDSGAAGSGSAADGTGPNIFSRTAFATSSGLVGGGPEESTPENSSSGSALAVENSGSAVKSGADSGIFGKLGKETSGSGSGSGGMNKGSGSAEDMIALEKAMAEKANAKPKQDGGWIKDEDYCPVPYAATFSQPLRRRWRKPKFLECPEPKPAKKAADGKTADYFPAGEQKKSGLAGSLSQSLSSMSKSISQSMSKLGSKTGMSSADQSGMGGSSVQSGGGSAAARLGQEPQIGKILGGKIRVQSVYYDKKQDMKENIDQQDNIQIPRPKRLESNREKNRGRLLSGGNPWILEDASKINMDLMSIDRKQKKRHKKRNSNSASKQIEVNNKVVEEDAIKSKSNASRESIAYDPELISATGFTVIVESKIPKDLQLSQSFLRSRSLPHRARANGKVVGGMSTTELSSSGSGGAVGSNSGMASGSGSGSGIGSSSGGGSASGTAGSSGLNDASQSAEKPLKTGCRVCQVCPFDNTKKYPGFISDIKGKWSSSHLVKKKKKEAAAGPPPEDPFANMPEEKSGGSGLAGKISSSLSSMGKSMSKSLSSLSNKSGMDGNSKSKMNE